MQTLVFGGVLVAVAVALFVSTRHVRGAWRIIAIVAAAVIALEGIGAMALTATGSGAGTGGPHIVIHHTP